MAERSYPFDIVVSGDRQVSSADHGQMLAALFQSAGVARNIGGELEPSLPGGMFVQVATGLALVEVSDLGYVYRNTAALNVAVPVADPTNPRKDILVLELSTANREVTAEVVAGTPAGSPTAPTPTSSQLLLATFDVAALASAPSGLVDGRVFAGLLPVGVDVQIFTASGTWNKPPGVMLVMVEAVGGGGGGGGGDRRAAGTNRFAGGGGGSGVRTLDIMPASDLSASETVTIGAGGAGATGAGSDSSGGGDGSGGGDTTFGSLVLASGGRQGQGGGNPGRAYLNNQGLQDTPNNQTRYTQPGMAGSDGGTGSVTAPGDGSRGRVAPGGGGGGGGVNTSNVAVAGGDGGDGRDLTVETFTTGAAGGSGGAATGAAGGDGTGWDGGGGGGGNAAGAGGDGGDGGIGAGGGGGGGGLNGSTGSVGGDGGDGWMRVIAW